MTWLRTQYVRWRFARCFKHLDTQIAEARRKHRPTSHLLAAKTAMLHAALAGGR